MISLKCLQKCKIANFPPFSLLHILVLPLLSKYGRKNRFLFFPIGQQAMDKTLGRLTRRFPDIYLSEYNLRKLDDTHHPVSFLLALLLNGTWLQCFQGELRVECCEQQKEHSLHFFS